MGQAKQKRAAQAAQAELMQSIDFARVATAVRKLAEAASSVHGADCFVLTFLAREILARLGVQALFVAGIAAWRVGEGDGDVISHTPAAAPASPGLAYHTWLEIGGHIFDVTTYQLPAKAAGLDALDGGTTTVDWAPPYLLVPLTAVSSYQDVAKLHTGLFHYQRVPGLRTMLEKRFEPDLSDVEAAWLIYQNPDVQVRGPNQLSAGQGR